MAYDPARDAVQPPIASSRAPARDLLSNKGAQLLATELNAWWRDRGFPSVHHEVQNTTHRSGTVFRVRSNLLNGMPPRPTRR